MPGRQRGPGGLRGRRQAHPGLTAWQEPQWFFHCGDGAAFLGVVGEPNSLLTPMHWRRFGRRQPVGAGCRTKPSSTSARWTRTISRRRIFRCWSSAARFAHSGCP
ncbi:CbrC family protein [Streptomyces sp. XH2]|uniref:CbrC family protein n=1 Tax=Streptomyces sp. XH2 TaxID=3412483 RepID=UPI003C7D2F43